MTMFDKILIRTAGIGLLATIALYLFTFIPIIFFSNSVFMFLCVGLTITSLIVTLITGIVLGARFIIEVTK